MRVRLTQSGAGLRFMRTPFVVDVDLVTLGASVRLRSHSTDILVLREVLSSGALSTLPDALGTGTVIDLGANTGLTFRYLYARYPEAHFVLVEPDPENLEILQMNTRGVAARCKIVGACIGGHARRARLTTTRGEYGFQIQEVTGPDEGTVDVVTMDTLLQISGIDRIGVLKCDIEGAEAELFATCGSWIERVDNIVVECHDESMPTTALSAALIRNGAHFETVHTESNPGVGEVVTLGRVGS